MGCNAVKGDPISLAIDRELQDEKNKIGRMTINRILLLGTGESGKSTFAKQLQIFYGGTLPEDEVRAYRIVILDNLVYAIKGLIHAAKNHKIIFKDENMAKSEELLLVDYLNFNEKIGNMIKDVYEDPAIKEAFKLYNTFHLLDSSQYLFDNIDRIIVDGYLPTQDDIIRSRKKTSGVQESTLEIAPTEKIIIIDVGGQRSERRKWAMCFYDITALIFFTAISEYDIFLYEDNNTNRMQESLKLFGDVCSIPYFHKMPFILFLNKMDLFEIKMKNGVSIKSAFQEYNGPTEVEPCFDYISGKFKEVVQGVSFERQFFCHPTTAIDSKKLLQVWDNVAALWMNKMFDEQLNLDL